MKTFLNKLAHFSRKGLFLGTMASIAWVPTAFAAEDCDEETMDAFAYEDCVKAKGGKVVNNENFGGSADANGIDNADGMRSEEHTSELQSQR